MREDWVEVELGKVCDFIGGGTPSKSNTDFWNGSLSWASIKDIKGDYLFETKDFITEVGLKNSSANLALPDEIILATRINPGRPIISRIKTAINQDLKVVKPKIKVDIKYLFFTFKNSEKHILKVSSGTTVLGINLNNLKSMSIFLAPLPEQHAIVAKIEELFSDLDKGIADFKTAQDQLVIYRQAVLKKAFEGGLTEEWREKNMYSMDGFLKNLKVEKENAVKSKLISKSDYFPEFDNKDLTYQVPNNWISLPWKTITSNNKYAMKRGPFGSALKKEFFVEKGIVVYEQGHAINDEPFRHRYYITQEKFEELKAFKAQAGDMIISCSGATLGRICLLPENADMGVINQALLKIDLDEKVILKKFFLMLFRSETFQRLIFEKSLGTAMPNMIGMVELKEIPIPIPSIEEQHQIIQEIESRLSVCDKVEQSITESLEKAKALRQSILKKAFEGTLLSETEIAKCKQEPDYEPASVLLEKIKVEKKLNKKVK